ncbi:hypothetical protein, partial [Actinotalea sp. C106]|uniref:hypothetical protein n=1 Tax=Actinotalea sp. C106 TaxID=2908644 RepID=UPI0020276FAA
MTALLELGTPTRLPSGFADPTAAAPLSVLVRRFERPPTVQLSAGVLVVAGEGDAALRTATQMAHRAGLPTHEILLAGEIEAVPGHGRRLQTLSAVERVRARLPEDALTVIALGVPTDRSRWGESAAMLEALAPDQAWAALDARSKPADLRRWLRSVGL